MTITATSTALRRATTSTTVAATPETVRTARATGLAYLGLALTGLVGSLLIRSRLFVDDPATTLANLTDHVALARWDVVLELGVVITQALVALWFFRLFRPVHAFAAGSIAAFGLVNAVAILGSAAMLGAVNEVAADPSLAASGDPAATVQLLFTVSTQLWLVGGIFFGLWLIPMGWLALRSGWMPRVLGWLLVLGGVGYVLQTLLSVLIPDAASGLQVISLPATVGELWMVGYLLVRGVRRSALG